MFKEILELTRISYFIKTRKHLFQKTIAIIAIFGVSFTNLNVAYANEFINEAIVSTSSDQPITGTAEQIVSANKDINNFLNYKLKYSTDNKLATKSFAEKPVITDTVSRKEIEEEKQAEIDKANYAAYQSTLAYSTPNTSRNVIVRDSSATRNVYSDASSYYYGYCTWYVASQKNIPSLWGNAGEWLYSAQNSGYAIGAEPKEGSIIVTNESGWGHVGIVEKVENDTVTISEMNYAGWGIVNNREINENSSVIQGFIYY